MTWAKNELEILENEAKFTTLLAESEYRGLQIDRKKLQRKAIQLIQEQIVLRTEIEQHIPIKGFNPGSPKQLAQLFHSYGVEPLKYTKPTDKAPKGNISWDAEALEQVNIIEHGETAYKSAQLFLKLSDNDTALNSFAMGWLERADSNGRVHPDYRQAGTKTSRLSCSDPNAQNYPPWMQECLVIPEGMVGVKWDLGQVEYRIFSHYADNPVINALYAKDVKTDFHKIRADQIGFPRKAIKAPNFGIIFGMGNAKLKRTIVMCLPEIDSQGFREVIKTFSGDLEVPAYPLPISSKLADTIAENVMKMFHHTCPEIKQLMKKVKQVLETRGYVKNIYGRRYFIPLEKSYVGLNAIIQGGAADTFKQLLVQLHTVLHKESMMVNNIHDADMSIMWPEQVDSYIQACGEILQNTAYKIPLVMDIEIASGNWANKAEIKKYNFNWRDAYEAVLKAG